MAKRIAVIGTFDTKATEYKYLIDLILAKGHQVLTVNTGVFGSTDLFPVDTESAEVASAAGTDIEALRKAKDRGQAIAVMSEGIAVFLKERFARAKFDGVIGMGGSAGTHIVTAGMRVLPFGLPKICVTTVASGDVSPYVGISDITMMPSLTDIAGINALSKIFLGNAAGAICGMVETSAVVDQQKPAIAASMFGNTTPCINRCREMLTAKDFEVLVFHATGAGGKTMEKLVRECAFQGVLDLTTTEWADTVCGGVFDAGKERLDAPGKMGIPHLISPGCIDMCNFGNPATVPSRYQDRLFYQWNPNVTLMRTSREENRKMGEIFAQKANAAQGKVAFIIPLRGFSLLDALNENDEPLIFWDEAADKAFMDGLKNLLNPKIEIETVDANINDPIFAEKAVKKLLDMM